MATETVTSSEGGPNAYAMRVTGNLLAPEARDGDCLVFCPDAGRALGNEIAAVWAVGATQPGVFRLASAVPPIDVSGDNFDAALALHTTKGVRIVPMNKIAKVHRMVEVLHPLPEWRNRHG